MLWEAVANIMKSEMHVYPVVVVGIKLNLSCILGICNLDGSGSAPSATIQYNVDRSPTTCVAIVLPKGLSSSLTTIRPSYGGPHNTDIGSNNGR